MRRRRPTLVRTEAVEWASRDGSSSTVAEAGVWWRDGRKRRRRLRRRNS